ncbi:unnamed protein product [Heligmosomoides polygyrus]|uniref:Phosphate transporter n=1 Tax=Heligmosomoides polygyrus TaxID=6339 RepID=A0A3P7XKG6_HELPZ|nr:unnamed protein product [Heligmosomoides polygyrus]
MAKVRKFVLKGWSVTDTMRKGVVDVTEYYNDPKELMLGQVAILGGTAAWLAITTAVRMPVSTTHAMVGSTLGFSLVLRGTEGVNWDEIYRIGEYESLWSRTLQDSRLLRTLLDEFIISWFLSPALSGLISVVLYLIVDFAVLRRVSFLEIYSLEKLIVSGLFQNHPFECGLRSLPVFYFIVVAFNVLMVTWDGSKLLHFDRIPFWGAVLISIAIGLIVALLVQFVVKPRLWRKIHGESLLAVWPPVHSSILEKKILSNNLLQNPRERIWWIGIFVEVRLFVKWILPDIARIDDDRTIQLFAWIQIFTACFAGFATGANDVRFRYTFCYMACWQSALVCGPWATVLSALWEAVFHTSIRQVVVVGAIRDGEGVKWTVFRNIVITWLSTVPASALLSAGIMYLLKFTL